MAKKEAIILTIMLFISVQGLEIISKNFEELWVKEGQEVTLLCSADVKVEICTFRSPDSGYFDMTDNNMWVLSTYSA